MAARHIAALTTVAAVAGLFWLWPTAPLTRRASSSLIEDNDDYQWTHPEPDPKQPNNCGNCHAEIYREWSQSKHAFAATNPRVQKAFDAVHQSRRDDIGVCAKCHAPTMRDPNLDYNLHRVTGIDEHGVHCDYCHKVVNAPPGKFGTRFGSDGLWLARPFHGEMRFFGPLDDAVREGEELIYKPIYKDSRYCASCHEGVIYGAHVYSTYSEWLASPARLQGKQCQTCHMAPTGKMTNIAPGKGGSERAPRSLASHIMPGGTKEMLRRCLSVHTSVRGPFEMDLSSPNRQFISVEVQADNVGHRVPTGSPYHQLLLIVDILDADGRAVRLEGRPAWVGSRGIEGYGKRYAKQFDAGLGEVVSFWQPHVRVEDTRLYPGKVDRVEFTAFGSVKTVKVKLVYSAFENPDHYYSTVAIGREPPFGPEPAFEDPIVVLEDVFTVR